MTFNFHFRNVQFQSRSMKILCQNGHSKQKRKRSENFIKRELSLMKTLVTTVCVMVLCWTPYALCIMIDSRGVNYQLKKVRMLHVYLKIKPVFSIFAFLKLLIECCTLQDVDDSIIAIWKRLLCCDNFFSNVFKIECNSITITKVSSALLRTANPG